VSLSAASRWLAVNSRATRREIKHHGEVIRNVLTMRRGSRSAGMMWEIPRKLAGPLAITLLLPPPPPPPPPKLKLAPEVMNYFNEFTGVTRWRLVDYRGLSNLRICIKHECPALLRGNLPRSRACARTRACLSIGIMKKRRAEGCTRGAVMFAK